MLERQSHIFLSTGDIGENTATYREYSAKAPIEVMERFSKIYQKSIKKLEKVAAVKARRAWISVLTLMAIRNIMKRVGVGLGHLLPQKYADLASVHPVINKIVEEKTMAKGTLGSSVIKKALSALSISADQIPEIAPLLWWINILMESEVFEAVFKFHHLIHTKSLEIKDFSKDMENSLSVFEDHNTDYEYMDYEVRRALLSRCAELRSQYINKLNNAIIFVKFLRGSVGNPERWEWFVYDETMTYAASVYITETQKLVGLKNFKLNISSLIEVQKGTRSGAASSLASLILLSPIFMQYSIEAYKKAAVTPADIIVAVLRLTSKKEANLDFTVSIEEAIDEVIKFWGETDILRRLGKSTGNMPEYSNLLESFNISLALLINTGIEGIYISTMKKPVIKLPPRLIGYDSVFIRPSRLLSIINKLWR